MDFNDLEVDENQIYDTKINALKDQLQKITSRLSFPPFVQVGLAGYKIAEHYIGKGRLGRIQCNHNLKTIQNIQTIQTKIIHIKKF